MTLLIAVSFFVAALLYAMVGFGGGSTYAAVLALAQVDHTIAPIIVLVCNIVVVCGGVYHYQRAGLVDIKNILPLVICSVPFAWLGGWLTVSESEYLFMLGVALLVSGFLLLFERIPLRSDGKEFESSVSFSQWPANWYLVSPVFGGGLGLMAGIVGIGGGIFLAPLMHHFKMTTPKRIAATASVFILFNSVAGLGGQLSKTSQKLMKLDDFGYWLWLPLVVLLGGQLGSRISVRAMSAAWVKKLTGILVLTVGVRLLWVNGTTLF